MTERRPSATFLITTARSGTQWLAKTLGAAYPGLLEVRHEPVGYAYRPCENLRDLAKLRELRQTKEIAAHFAFIHDVLARRSYLETGFPAFALAPLLREEFGDRLRLVHLTRHPVRVAASLVTHGWYVDGRRPELSGTVALVPSDPNTLMRTHAERWTGLSAYEKALLLWHEVNRWGLEQEAASPPGTYARFKFERLLDSPDEREALRRFLDLPEREPWSNPSAQRIDNFRKRTGKDIDWGAIKRFPEVLDLAERLGFAVVDLDPRQLATRYRAGPARRAVRRVRRLLRSIVARPERASPG